MLRLKVSRRPLATGLKFDAQEISDLSIHTISNFAQKLAFGVADAKVGLQRDGLVEMAKQYLAGKDPRAPLAAPLYADLAGLPPLLIQVGTAETLLDDSTRIAERARKAGVKVTLEPWENMIHVFQIFAPMLDEGQDAIDKIGEFIRANAD